MSFLDDKLFECEFFETIQISFLRLEVVGLLVNHNNR